VDEDTIPRQFQKLEDRVGQLVQTCHDLQHSKVALQAKIGELEEALKARSATEQQYVEEKTMIRSKIDDLLSKLDQVLD
jgi:septation ring formation regulator EzrA